MAHESFAETLEPSAVFNDPSPDTSVSSDISLSRNVSFSRLNAGAPEFVPRTSNLADLQQQQQPRLVIPQGPGPMHVFPSPNSPFHVQLHNHVAVQNHVQYQYYGGFGEQENVQRRAPADLDHAVPVTRNGLSEETTQKILNQVEYYFSDANLATTDHLIRFINKDPEGFVPISVVASFRKIKALISSHHQLATILRASSKLVVSEDGKKVRRQHPLTESNMEDLQSRIIIAENLPEDHSYQNLMKVFSAVGSVKTIRTCQPQTANGGAAASRLAKMDNMLFSNKLHAFVEYETLELAEKAIVELNDERNWRSGLRVRLLLRHTSKSAQARGRKAGHEGEGNYEEDDECTSGQPNEKQYEDSCQPSDAISHDHPGEEVVNDKENGLKRARVRGRGKGRGRGQPHNNRGSVVGTPPLHNSIQNDQPTVTKQPPGPRMPDGTRGFTMGRGKPVVATST